MEEDREEEGAPDPLVFGLHWRRVNPRAASDGGAWEDAPPLFSAPGRLPRTVRVHCSCMVLEALRFFRVYFVFFLFV